MEIMKKINKNIAAENSANGPRTVIREVQKNKPK
jgi:hypothetical protein